MMIPNCCCCPVALLALALIGYFIYKYFFATPAGRKPILEKDWKKDTVYLYQFPRARTVPSVSPFCLKLETYCRINKIPYENRFLMSARSQYGLLPFIELNGEHIADSQLAEEAMRKHFDVKPLPSERDEAMSRALSRMVDQHTFLVFYKFKAYDDPSKIINIVFEAAKVPSFLKPLLMPVAYTVFKWKAGKRISTALGMFSDSEFSMLLRKDLDVLRDVLADQKYMFGDEITAADCTVFGHLASTCYIPSTNEVKSTIQKDYPTLVQYQERIKKAVYENDFETTD